MVKTKNSVARHRRKKRLFKLAKGYVGNRKNHLRLTLDAVMKAMAYNYCHRKHNKRNFRRLWNIRIGIASKINGISYSKFVFGLKKAGSELNRKILSDMAITDPKAFTAIADIAKGVYSEA